MKELEKKITYILLCLSGVAMSTMAQEWGEWITTPCSASCGPGTREETRECLNGNTCAGANRRVRRCNGDCQGKGWGQWMPSGRCSVTCESGYRFERRRCQSISASECQGSSTRYNTCDTDIICPIWSEWFNGTCSTSCGSGVRVDRRLCLVGRCVGPNQRESECVSVRKICPRGEWSPWTPWSSCSVECESGVRVRSRFCVGGLDCEGESVEEESCMGDSLCLCSCPPVSSCEDRLSKGFCQSATPQRCMGIAGYISACAQTCKSCDMCPGCNRSSWGGWKEGECNCLTRTKTDTRTCLNLENAVEPCRGPDTRSVNCADECIWGAWRLGPCSVTCGSGTRSDTRSCSNGNLCIGPSSRIEECVTGTPCRTSSSCRDINPNCHRFSAFCEVAPFEVYLTSNCQGTCQNLCHEWSAWTMGECTPGCGGIGIQTDTRTCSGSRCIGDDSRQRVCNQPPCSVSEYGEWTDIGSCSVTCGRGQITQTRECIRGSCPNRQRTVECVVDDEICDDARLGSFWSPWSRCSNNCGPGTQAKRRRCSNCPNGFSEIRRRCNNQSCPDINICSRECGSGTFFDSVSRRYLDCDNGLCPIQSCPSGWRNRYREPHACCDTSSSVSKTCGMANTARILPRIINGRNATIMNWPWTVQLSLDGDFACGAILVSRSYVITAAHCVFQIAADRISLVMGATRLQDSIANRTASEVFVHEQYNATGGLENDIALLRLDKPVDLGVSDVNNICLPDGETVPIDIECVVAGWGRTTSNPSPTSEILQEATVRILPPDICRRAYRGFFDPSNRICAGRVDGSVDTCTGDSGGPLMCQRCSSCAWMLAGVTSFGGIPCARPNNPGVYTRVFAYEEWLHGIINDLPNPTTVMPSCLD